MSFNQSFKHAIGSTTYNKYSNIHSIITKNPFQKKVKNIEKAIPEEKETNKQNSEKENDMILENFNYTIDHSVSEIENVDPASSAGPQKYYFPKPTKQSTAIDLLRQNEEKLNRNNQKLKNLSGEVKLRAPLRTISLQKLADSTKRDLKRLSQSQKPMTLDQASKILKNQQISDSKLLTLDSCNTSTIPRNYRYSSCLSTENIIENIPKIENFTELPNSSYNSSTNNENNNSSKIIEVDQYTLSRNSSKNKILKIENININSDLAEAIQVQNQPIPAKALQLGRSAAWTFNQKKKLNELGQNLALKISAKMYQYTENNKSKGSCSKAHLEKLENWLDHLEMAYKSDEEKTTDQVSNKTNSCKAECKENRDFLMDRLKEMEEENEKLKSEKAALLDELFKAKASINSSQFLE